MTVASVSTLSHKNGTRNISIWIKSWSP